MVPRRHPYSTTFYPSSIARERATPVDAAGGKEVSGIEIRLSRQKGISISGTVSGIPERGAPSILVQRGNSAGQVTSSTTVTSEAGGKFTVANAQPGYYRISASFYGQPRLASQVVEFQVDTVDVSNVDLVLAPGAEVSGAVEFEGDPPGTVAEKRTVRLEAASGGFSPLQPTGGETDCKGAFRLEGVGAGKFRVKVEPLPENAYVKKVEFDGSPVDGTIVELKSGGRSARLKVTIRRNGGQLTGRVPVEGLKHFGKTTRTRPDGAFEIWRVDPGKYTLRANLYTPASQMSSAPLEIEVGDTDLTDIALQLVAPSEIRGVVEFDDDDARKSVQPTPATQAAAEAAGAAESPRDAARWKYQRSREWSNPAGRNLHPLSCAAWNLSRDDQWRAGLCENDAAWRGPLQ